MIEGLGLLYKHRNILFATTITDVRAKYRGTMLGLLWTVIYPLMFLGLYAAIYLLIFQVRLPDYSPFQYVLLVFCGLVPFLGFAESLGTGVTSVNSNKSLIRNTMFPIELIPVKAVLTSIVTMSVGLGMLLLALWTTGEFHLTQILVPVIVALQVLFMIGLIWLLSALNVFFQDLGQMVGVIILFLMLVSPIAYTQEMIPPNMMLLMYPNPLYYMIMIYRDTLMLGEFPVVLFVIFCLITVVVFTLGFFVFNRLKPMFADYV